MHIPDGLLDVATSAGTTAVSGATLAYALHRVRRDLPDRAAPLMGMTAACLFAAQTLNFPLFIAPTSGHLLGGVLAAVLLGPWGGILVIAAVVVVQCLLFQDGGLTALGANTLILGLVGSGLGYAIFSTVRRWVPGQAGVVAGATVAAWFSVQLGAVVASVLIAIGPNFAIGQILGVMLLAHAIIGLAEAVVTGLAVSFVMRARPDLIYGEARDLGRLGHLAQVALAGGAIAAMLAVFLAPLASGLPDGLEHSLLSAGFDPSAAVAVVSAPFADYQLPGLQHLAVAGSIVSLVGVVAVFILAYGLARAVGATPSSSEHTPHAS